MMRFKKILMTCLFGSIMGFSLNANAAVACQPYCGPWVVCTWMEILNNAAGFVARKWNKAQMNPTIDIHDGLEKIKENIGMYRDQGKCGRSATGNSGCDLTTPEQGAAEDAQMALEEQVIPKSTVDIIFESESGKVSINGSDVDAKQIAHDGVNQLDDDKNKNKKEDVIALNKGDLFKNVRANVTSYIFESDDPKVNEGCSCAADPSECTTECAQERQNDALFVASLGASARSDSFLKDMDGYWKKLEDYVSSVDGASTLADFVGELGNLSVYASSLSTEQMVLQAHDLRAQSYRNLMFSGTQELDLESELNKKDTNGGNGK